MTTEEKIAVMQAFVDGKQIQYKKNSCNDWKDCSVPVWSWCNSYYRIKPEEKKHEYRPYKDTDEMVADFCERFGVEYPAYGMPFIWVMDINNSKCRRLVTELAHSCVWPSERKTGFSLEELFKICTYLDGSPVGKLVEE